jgi:hypothetical protein
MARTSFSGPVASANGFIGAMVGSPVAPSVLTLPTYTLASVAAVPKTLGTLVFVSNASAGLGAVCFGNGTAFIDIATGLAVA